MAKAIISSTLLLIALLSTAQSILIHESSTYINKGKDKVIILDLEYQMVPDHDHHKTAD